MIYRLFDVPFKCVFELPELEAVRQGVPEFEVVLGAPERWNAESIEPRFRFTDRYGEVSCWCAEWGGDRLFVFPGFASFVVGRNRIRCALQRNGTESMLRHLLLNQVIPRFLGSAGRLVVHASAVTVRGAGATAAFLGHSGYGKSTLASTFHRHGADLISDDGVRLKPSEGGFSVIGGLPSIRLFPDSLEAVFTEANGFYPYTEATTKKQMMLRSDAIAPRSWRDLNALFLLNDPVDDPAEEISVCPESGGKAVMVLIGSLFNLDPSDKRTAAASLRNAASVLSGELPVYRLAYPRRLDALDEIRAAVVSVMA